MRNFLLAVWAVLYWSITNTYAVDLYRYMDLLPPTISNRDFTKLSTEGEVINYYKSCLNELENVGSNDTRHYINLCIELHDICDQFYEVVPNKVAPIEYTLKAINVAIESYGIESEQHARLLADYLIYDCRDIVSRKLLAGICQDGFELTNSLYSHIKYKSGGLIDDTASRPFASMNSAKNSLERRNVADEENMNFIWACFLQDSIERGVEQFSDFIRYRDSSLKDIEEFKKSVVLQQKHMDTTGLLLRLLSLVRSQQVPKSLMEEVGQHIDIVEKTIIHLQGNVKIHRKANGLKIGAYLQALKEFMRTRNINNKDMDNLDSIGFEYYQQYTILPECYKIALDNFKSVEKTPIHLKKRSNYEDSKAFLKYVMKEYEYIHSHKQSFAKIKEIVPPIISIDQINKEHIYDDFLTCCIAYLDAIDKRYNNSFKWNIDYTSDKTIQESKKLREYLLANGWTGSGAEKQIIYDNVLDYAIEYIINREIYLNNNVPVLLTLAARRKYNTGDIEMSRLYSELSDELYNQLDIHPLSYVENKMYWALTEPNSDKKKEKIESIKRFVPVMENKLLNPKGNHIEGLLLDYYTNIARYYLEIKQTQDAESWLNKALDKIYLREGSKWYTGASVIIPSNAIWLIPIKVLQKDIFKMSGDKKKVADSVLEIEGSFEVASEEIPLDYIGMYLDNELTLYSNISKGDYDGEDLEDMDDMIEKSRMVRDNIVRYSSHMHPSIRKSYYDSARNLISLYNSYLVKGNLPESTKSVFDNLLLFHGLQLLNEKLVNQAIQYDEICKQYLSLVDSSSRINAGELRAIYNRDGYYRKIEERALSVENIKNILQINTDSVKSNLDNQSAAIEFFKVNKSIGINAYCAVILKNNSMPIIVHLCTEKELKKVSPSDYYKSAKLYNMIWRPLLPFLDGIKDVYFTPDAELNSIAIEYLPVDKRTVINEKFNMRRLSSSRELCIKQSKKEDDFCVLYGGLKYSVDTNAMVVWNKNSKRGKKGGLDEIYEETLQEVLEISSYASENCIKNKVYQGLEGTETSFKNLSNTDVTLLHLSTHGFYNPGFNTNSSSNNQEDKIMSSSGLLLSGSGAACEGAAYSTDIEDGILTSLEISQLNFPNLDLVALSACETGLGEIKTTEGVYGLQRAFKKAGARSILMSLWEVDDIATRLFMVEFYRCYFSGETKQESLKAAQYKLRNYVNNKGVHIYNSPEYWSAFVLLDAIN